MTVSSRDRSTILIHYYRAMIGRADVWRMRMDATTNWAIGATAAVISFVLSDANTPHYVVFIAVLLTVSFLLLEARRLSFYHLWQQRALLVERALIRPALHATQEQAAEAGLDAASPVAADLRTSGPSRPPVAEDVDLVAALDPHLGRTVPNMPAIKAIARRLRRIYLYLFAVQVLAWGFKLAEAPTSARSLDEWIARAATGAIPGGWIVGSVGLGLVGTIFVAAAWGGVRRDDKRAESDV